MYTDDQTLKAEAETRKVNILIQHILISTEKKLNYSGTRLSRLPWGMKNGAEITDRRVKLKPIWWQNINLRLKFLYKHDVR